MELLINGETKTVPTPLNIVDLLTHLELQGDRIAVELNRKIVRRDHWSSTELQQNDRLEIVHFVGGG